MEEDLLKADAMDNDVAVELRARMNNLILEDKFTKKNFDVWKQTMKDAKHHMRYWRNQHIALCTLIRTKDKIINEVIRQDAESKLYIKALEEEVNRLKALCSK